MPTVTMMVPQMARNMRSAQIRIWLLQIRMAMGFRMLRKGQMVQMNQILAIRCKTLATRVMIIPMQPGLLLIAMETALRMAKSM